MSPASLDRRQLLQASLALTVLPFHARADSLSHLPPLRIHPGRAFDITRTLTSHRAEGPRIESEQVGTKRVVHNYGHGDGGWSLSWGSAARALRQAMAANPERIAVVGCGIIGLTSAILAQQAGLEATIYARDLLPQTGSARDLGLWRADPASDEMARVSLRMHALYGNRPGKPLEWRDHYTFSGKQAYRSQALQFNIADYSHALLTDFFAAGGKFVRRQFHAPSELQTLDEKLVINCPGHEAGTWWNDRSLDRRTNRIAWLTPQSEMKYGFSDGAISVLSRRDAIAMDITKTPGLALDRIACLSRASDATRLAWPASA